MLTAKALESLTSCPPFGFSRVAGNLVEISGGGQLTFATILLLEAQQREEPCAWVSTTQHTVFPPDLETNGVDLETLIFLWVETPLNAARAVEYLLRSDSFGLVVLDMAKLSGLPDSVAGRLMRLARKSNCGVVALSSATQSPSVFGSLVSLRATSSLSAHHPGRLCAELVPEKDRSHAPTWRHSVECHAPTGLR